MAVVRCPRGHYYDTSRFSFCPYCGISPEMTGELGKSDEHPEAPDKTIKSRKRGVFSIFDFDHDKTVAKERSDLDDQLTVANDTSFMDNKAVAKDKSTSDEDELRTLAIQAKESSSLGDDELRTIGFFSGSKGNDYVTGWLVCIKGPEKGRDYRLHHGQNKVGKSFIMDVQIADDRAISDERHCTIVYEDKSREFFVVPGSGTLTYLNDELLSEAKTLTEGDTLNMGGSSFIFVPFCREGRTWD